MRISKRRLRAIPRTEVVATRTVRFGKKARRQVPRTGPKSLGRISRVTRLLALAHKIDGMIRSGEIHDWAEAARLVGVTRARMTQIANMLLLAPQIQETIVTASPDLRNRVSVTERGLRNITAYAVWRDQRRRWLQSRSTE